MKRVILDMYMDYWQDFLTVERFAEYYDISEEKAERVIAIGRRIHDKLAICMQYCHNFGYECIPYEGS